MNLNERPTLAEVKIEPLHILSAPYDQYGNIGSIIGAINNNRAKLNELIEAVNKLREGK